MKATINIFRKKADAALTKAPKSAVMQSSYGFFFYGFFVFYFYGKSAGLLMP
jgi:hypothetical protein